ncbi:GTP cyclohydrolase II [Nocardioides aestuarii]|uniref:GTP cyclohydrolase II n=1 Tax=Nocardioides aestuarii TaxID=252231 RepID=A0ABW4TMZ1_9ACTN
MNHRVPPAVVRGQVTMPVRQPGGQVLAARVVTFEGLADGREHLVVTFGDPPQVPLVRVHSECLTGDVLGSERCDCGPQLAESVARLGREGGHLLYLRQEGRGIGLYNKLDAYLLQDGGLDTFEANLALGFGPDDRDYTVAAQMLRAIGVEEVELLTNNPDKRAQLEAAGIGVTRTVPTRTHLTAANGRYLEAKRRRAVEQAWLDSVGR